MSMVVLVVEIQYEPYGVRFQVFGLFMSCFIRPCAIFLCFFLLYIFYFFLVVYMTHILCDMIIFLMYAGYCPHLYYYIIKKTSSIRFEGTRFICTLTMYFKIKLSVWFKSIPQNKYFVKMVKTIVINLIPKSYIKNLNFKLE